MLIVDLIQDHKWIVLAITTPLLLFYGMVLVRALFASPTSTRPMSVPVRRPPPKPLVKPPLPEVGKQESLVTSTEQGIAGHQRAGSAKTVKLPVTPSKGVDGATPVPNDAPPAPAVRVEVKTGPGHDTTAIKLPSQQDAAPTPPPGIEGGRSTESKTGLLRKASRMEQLGFHVGVHADEGPAAAPSDASAGDATKAAELPRSQTAELTSILERIDKFLAEDQPATPGAAEKPKLTEAPPMAAAPPPAQAPAAPAQPAAPAETPATKKTQPIWARADALDDEVEHPPSAAPVKPSEKVTEKPAERPTEKPADGDQQRLF